MTDRPDDALRRLCGALGVATGYHELDGRYVDVPSSSLRAVLRALGVALDSGHDVDAAVSRAQAARWAAVVEPLVHVAANELAQTVALRVPRALDSATLSWRIVEEGGARHDGELAVSTLPPSGEPIPPDAPCTGRALAIPVALPPGYHRLELRANAQPLGATMLIAAPAACWRPGAIERGARLWGPALQLYSLRSARNWGIGDFSDLAAFVAFVARQGADLVGLSPLHALFPHDPAHASPYSPSSRECLNALYVDVESVADVIESAEAQQRIREPEFRERLDRVRGASLVDYAGVAALKHEVLEIAYRHFRDRHLDRDSARAGEFRAFQAAAGQRLRRHALFDALQTRLHRRDATAWGWPAWPEPLRDPDGSEVAAFAAAQAERVEYFEYLQWLATGQLERAAQGAIDAGMAVGLYTDLAVSVDGGGSDAWLDQRGYATTISIGAPRDDFNSAGQDWGLPPMRPDRMRERRCDGFVAALRANMRCAGALRIDHVMGLMRLFWIPRGAPATEGTYVAYPFDTLLAIVALESHRARCMVVGEDLCTVPDAVREAMALHGMLSCRLMYFEREDDREFRPPSAYPCHALVSVGTHDLPTLAGWWSGNDLRLRDSLGLIPEGMSRSSMLDERARDRGRLLRALGMAPRPEGVPCDAALAAAVLAHLAATPSMLMTVQVEDLLGVDEQPNVPGTVDEHPNWRRRLPVTLEDFGANDRAIGVMAAIAAVRGRVGDLQ